MSAGVCQARPTWLYANLSSLRCLQGMEGERAGGVSRDEGTGQEESEGLSSQNPNRHGWEAPSLVGRLSGQRANLQGAPDRLHSPSVALELLQIHEDNPP